mmetsp:Transcript_21191/g.65261  ORF Transcript_21191/g.65261 Transcript_21191/m.65261 type:complete len:92 (-) Transcript_21191:101-376(-)
MAWNELLDFSTACRREAREQDDRRRLEARRRVREDVGGRTCSVKMARDASTGDVWHWWREAVHNYGSEQQAAGCGQHPSLQSCRLCTLCDV